MPSLTASTIPPAPIRIRIGVAGAWRTTIGPSRDPIRHPAPSGMTAAQCTGATNAKITAIYMKLQEIIKSGNVRQLQPQLQQAAATIAKGQKALVAALAQHDEMRTLLGQYFEISAAPEAPAFLLKLKRAYQTKKLQALAQFNGVFGRLIVEKDGLFRRARDAMSASVSYVGSGAFRLTITDSTQGWSQTVTQRLKSAKRGSAEVIAEAPSSSGGVLPLADFQKVGFSGAMADGSLLTASTPGIDPITMVTSSGVVKAEPSSIKSGSFTDTWFHQ